jgi:DNA replication ATP-dependent helicase Dna2
MSIIEEFRAAIELHQRKDDENFDEQMDLPLQERVSKGITMTNLRVSFEFYDSAPNNYCPRLTLPNKFIKAANVFCQNNISKFREGASVWLSNGDHKFKMEIIEDSLDNFTLAPNDFDVKNCHISFDNYVDSNWEINIVKTSITQKLLGATASNLLSDPARLKKIDSLLMGSLRNEIQPEINFSLLNDSQNSSIIKAISVSDFHLIQGPPGTGKTETISQIAKLLVDEGKRVFVTGPTHTSINNCLSAISTKVNDATKLVKIGEKYQAAEILNIENITRKTRLPLQTYNDGSQFSKEGIIIGGTPYSMCYPASKRLDKWEFDVALIDEAAQMSIPLAISIMSKADKFIFVGDHKQLAPIIPSGSNNSMFSGSIFSRLIGLYPTDSSFLKTSYRLNEDLIRIPNKLFYDNQLESVVSLKAESKEFNSDIHSDILNHKDSKILYLHKVFDSQGRSPYEAGLVSELVQELIKNNINIKDIGVLTPYRAQVREIKKAISQKINNSNSDLFQTLFVDTVDRMQGQERDYIIYSMSNSHPLESKRRLDFFYNPNRLNVAITRAIKKCIVIANYKVFDIIDEELLDLPEFPKLKPDLDVFKKYYNLSSKLEEAQNDADNW